MSTDVSKRPKGILKKPTPATATAATTTKTDEDQNKKDLNAREIATQHAQIIHSRREVEDTITDALITLSRYPLTPSATASSPSEADSRAFKARVRLFQPSDYEDLIEERNANGLCGYALCPNPRSKTTHGGNYKLVNLGRSDFNIVPSREIERWCSQGCARRAMYVKVQLQETAAAERAGVASIRIDLLEEGEQEKDKQKEQIEEMTQKKRVTTSGDDVDGKKQYKHSQQQPSLASENHKADADIKAARNARDLALERGDDFDNKTKSKRSVKVTIREKPVTAPAEGPSLSTDGQSHLVTEGYKTTFSPKSDSVNLKTGKTTEEGTNSKE